MWKRLVVLEVIAVLALSGYLISKSYAANATKMTTEVLVLNSAATELPRLVGSKGFEVYNHGPNTIFCSLGSNSADAVIDKARPVLPEGAWSGDVNSNIKVYCKAKTADQLTGGGTIMTEKGSP